MSNKFYTINTIFDLEFHLTNELSINYILIVITETFGRVNCQLI